MNMKPLNVMSLLACVIILCSATALAQDGDARLTLSAGAEYTSGRYGGDADIEDLYVPLTATVDYGHLEFRLTVPYLSVTAPEGTVIIGPGGEPVPGTGETVTESGLGDVIGSMTIYDVIYSRQLGLAMDLTGKVKFGTADVDKGLGSGENDYSVRADFYKFANQLTLLGSIGYKVRGEPTGVDLNNALMASVGANYRITPIVNAGLFFDYRESAISGNDSIQELSGFVSRRFNENWRFQAYALTGFTDSSPDWGVGIQFKRILNQ
jgi:hypothetical protein